MHATTRPQDDTDAEPHAWTVEGDDYGPLMAEVRAAVPAGWVLLHVQIARSHTGSGG